MAYLRHGSRRQTEKRKEKTEEEVNSRMSRTIAAAAIFIIVMGIANLNAEVVAKSGTFSGVKVDYKDVLPTGYDSGKTYPAILAFAGGGQEMRIVDGVIK